MNTIPKTVKKKELFDYLGKLKATKTVEIKDKYRPKLKEIGASIIEAMNSHLQTMDEMRRLIKDVLPLESYYSISGHDYEINRYKNLSSASSNPSVYIIGGINRKVQNVSDIILSEYDQELLPEGLVKDVKRFNQVVNECDKELSQVNKLHNELYGVVSSQRRGKDGFKELVRLGLDMTEFLPAVKETKAAVPMLVETSVDINLLNNVKVVAENEN